MIHTTIAHYKATAKFGQGGVGEVQQENPDGERKWSITSKCDGPVEDLDVYFASPNVIQKVG